MYILLFTTYFASKLRLLLTPLARIRIFNSPFVTIIRLKHISSPSFLVPLDNSKILHHNLYDYDTRIINDNEYDNHTL